MAGLTRGRLAKLNAEGTVMTSFDTVSGASNDIRALAIQNDGKLVIGGDFTSYRGTFINRIARVNTDGTLDTSFNPGTGANSDVNAIAIQSDGKIVIGGEFTTINGTSANYIARLNSDGSLDTSFSPTSGPDDAIEAIGLYGSRDLHCGPVHICKRCGQEPGCQDVLYREAGYRFRPWYRRK